MSNVFRIPRCGVLLTVITLTMSTAAMAQMGGMRGGSGSIFGGNSLGGMFGGALSGMMGGGTGLSIGTDGTLYLSRSAPTQNQSAQPTSTQLTAIDLNGNVKWSLPIDSSSASQPAVGKDGTLFVTTSDWSNWMYDWMYNRSIPTAGSTPNLLVIKPGATSATIFATIPLTGQIASSPQIATDGAGSYVVYVVCVDAFAGNALNTTATSGSYLYAFSPSGILKYKLQLSQGGSGIMGPGMMGGF